MNAKLRLAEIDTASKAFEAERQSILDQMAREACPFVPGDVISFNFEMTRETGAVLKVFGQYGEYSMTVERLRADGMPGSRVSVYSWDEPAKAVASQQ